MPFAACSDVKIYYEIKGSGQRLLYISGTGTDLRRTPNVFTSVFPDHFKTLSFDQHGLGQTDKPDEPYGKALYGEDAAALLDTIGWNDCYVIGASFGGMVAQELALNRPELIKKLVLCCTFAGGAGGASYPLHELQHMALEKKIKFRLPKNDKRLDKIWQQENPEKFQELFEQGLKAAQFAANEPGKAIGARRQLEARALPRCRRTIRTLPGSSFRPGRSLRSLRQSAQPCVRWGCYSAGWRPRFVGVH